VLVDEAQFLTKRQVHHLSDVADVLDVPVLAYGLRRIFKAISLKAANTCWPGWIC